MRVVVAADETYAMPLAVCVRSILDNAAKPVEIVVLAREVTATTISALKRSWDHSSAVRFHAIDPSSLAGLGSWGYITNTAYARVLIPDIVPGAWSRVVYLDADTVVLSDLSELINVDLSGNPVAACPDPLFGQWWSRHAPAALRQATRGPTDQLFNTGVMVLDLAHWRRTDLSRRTLEIAHELPPQIQSDQAAANLAVGQSWTRLDVSWNVTTDMYFRANRAAYSAAIATKRIRHFTAFKPWHERYKRSPDADLFEAYRSRTAYA